LLLRKEKIQIEEENKKQKNNLDLEIQQSPMKLKHYGTIMHVIFNNKGEPILEIGPHCKINLY
jgi:hypothetical protein